VMQRRQPEGQWGSRKPIEGGGESQGETGAQEEQKGGPVAGTRIFDKEDRQANDEGM